MKLYTVAEVAKAQRTTAYTVRRWIKEKRLTAEKHGGQFRITAAALAAFRKPSEHPAR